MKTTTLHDTRFSKILLLRVKMLRKINRMKQGIPKKTNVTTVRKSNTFLAWCQNTSPRLLKKYYEILKKS